MGYLDNTGLTYFWSKVKAALAEKQNTLQEAIVSGTYVGQAERKKPDSNSTTVQTKNSEWRNITVGFKPRIVLLLTETGVLSSSANYSGGGSIKQGGIFFDGNPLSNTCRETLLIGAEMTSTGFRVRNITGWYQSSNYTIGNETDCDLKNADYQWIAFK